MGIQSSINSVQGFGIPGELYTNGPVRGQSFQLRSNNVSNNVFGRAFSILSEGVAVAGNNELGEFPFAGIMVNPKGSKLNGVIQNPLAPTLTVPNGTMAEIVNFGEIVVWIYLPLTDNNARVGDLVIYQITTGILGAINPLGPIPAGYLTANAVISRFSNTSPIITPSDFRLAVIRMTTTT